MRISQATSLKELERLVCEQYGLLPAEYDIWRGKFKKLQYEHAQRKEAERSGSAPGNAVTPIQRNQSYGNPNQTDSK